MKTTNVYNQVQKAIAEGYSLIVLQGGQGCFTSNQKVITYSGLKNINEINLNDSVLSYNETSKKNEFKKVINTFKYKKNNKLYRVTLKNGEVIECTENHEFFYKGGWYSLKHLLSL